MSVPTIHNNERTAIRVNLFKPSSNYIKRLTLNNNIKITQKFPISAMYNKKYVSLAFMSYSRCQNKKEIVKIHCPQKVRHYLGAFLWLSTKNTNPILSFVWLKITNEGHRYTDYRINGAYHRHKSESGLINIIH